tara:strand:+ start:1126 stop:1404 length:279 start_codon:yes stop_codon:yes gene_type:complete
MEFSRRGFLSFLGKVPIAAALAPMVLTEPAAGKMFIASKSFMEAFENERNADLADLIYNVDPIDVPFLSSTPQNQATATLHQWQTDALVRFS